jgi:FkbM family methyltransferase
VVARRLARRVVGKLQAMARDRGTTRPWETPQSRSATPEDIYYCFRLLLGRAPNRVEWSGHVAQAGTDLDAVVRSYLESREFALRSGALLGHRLAENVTLLRLDGFSIYVPKDDQAVGRHLVEQRTYEPHVTAVLRERLRPGMHVLDIGANIGYFTMLFAAAVGPSGRVFAVEPNAECARLIEASRRENSFGNVIVVQAAAGRELGLLVLNATYSNAMTGQLPDDVGALITANSVPSVKLDDVLHGERLDIVKIDVEGAEYVALLGMADAIQRWHPTIVSEFSPEMMPGISGIDGRGYLRFLVKGGYGISVIQQDGSLLGCGADIERVMTAWERSGIDHVDLLLEPLA